MKLRLFIGIPVSEDILTICAALRKKQVLQPNLRWVNSENLHVTTCFIGDVQEENLPEIKTAIQHSINQTKRFYLKFDQFVYAPKRRPYMIWGKFEKSGNFTQLTNSLHQHLRIEKDHADAIPHITLARFNGKPEHPLYAPDIEMPDLEVNSVTMWQSVLKPTGAVYHEIQSYPFLT